MTTLTRLGPRALLVALTMYLVMTGATVPTALYGLWAHQYGFGTLMITVIFSVYVIGVVGGLLGLGGVSDAIGRRPVLLASVAAATVSDVGYLLAHSLTMIFVARLVSGLATGLVAGTATAAMVDLAPAGMRGPASMTALVANAGGLASGPILGGAFAQHLGSPTRLVYVAHLVLLAIAAVGTWYALPRGRRRPEVSLRPRGLAVPIEVRAPFWRSSTAGGAGFAVGGLINVVVGAFLVQLVHIHDLLLAGVIAGMIFGTVAVGQVMGRGLNVATGMLLACAGLFVSCGLTALSLATGSVEVLVVAGITAGIGTGLAIGQGIATINTRCPPERRGETNSAFFAVMYVGLAVPVVGAGVAVNRMGLRSGGELFSAAVGVVVLAVGLSLLRELRPARAPQPALESASAAAVEDAPAVLCRTARGVLYL